MLKEGLDQPKRMAHLPNSFEFIVNSLPTQKCSPSGCGEGPIFSSSSWAPPFCTFLPLLFSQQVLGAALAVLLSPVLRCFVSCSQLVSPELISIVSGQW